VSWRHRISIVVLVVISALPLSATLCAMLCDSAASSSTAAHHRSGKRCEDPAMTPAGLQLSAASDHDCGTHDARLHQAVTTTASRPDSLIAPNHRAAILGHSTTKTLSEFHPTFAFCTPPDGRSRTASPLVLRV
jgi:hypothetical protein